MVSKNEKRAKELAESFVPPVRGFTSQTDPKEVVDCNESRDRYVASIAAKITVALNEAEAEARGPWMG